MKTISIFTFILLFGFNSNAILGQTTTKTIYSNTINTIPTTPSSTLTPASSIIGYNKHYVMHDDVTHYFLMPTGKVIDQNGQEVGYKTAPPKGREDEFVFMLKMSSIGITYAVDQYGHVWQNKRPFKEIVGQEKK